MGIDERNGEEMIEKISKWNMAYMVSVQLHIDKMPVWTDDHYKHRIMYVKMRIAMSRIRLYFKYIFMGLVKR